MKRRLTAFQAAGDRVPKNVLLQNWLPERKEKTSFPLNVVKDHPD